ncbi:hypothetical protein DTL42_11575 [Bremerella cremea]|uniref:Uncharacterized protein n=1 Tax=Bremerella cremea TaxID=1031537 RepID=A0A368KQL6_9BACT|nr:hypothetical protein [Bremerella cremea]RCS49175.1 hypothetical protein DTL42_11575 [Bremerella cremea]
MLGEPRAILFHTELEFLPIDELSFGKAFGRKLYAQMAQLPVETAYDNIEMTSSTITLSTDRSSSSRSSIELRKHSLTIEELKPDFEVETFQDIVSQILQAVRDVDHRCPPVVMQRCKIHCLAQPHNVRNSLDLLAGRVASVMDKIDPFERPPSFFGVRFRFMPPEMFAHDHVDDGQGDASEETTTDYQITEVDDSTPRHHGSFVTMRFETYAQDIRQVWMEIASTYPVLPPIDLDSQNFDPILSNIDETYKFVTEKGRAFLGQFDVSDNENKDDENEMGNAE